MPWFYVTVQKVYEWNIGIEAEDLKQAGEKAVNRVDSSWGLLADRVKGPKTTFIEEVKKHAE